jgi:chromate reductase
MQMAFYGVFLFLDMKPVLKPEILVANASTKFDQQGNLTDEKAKELIKQKLETLKSLVLQLHANEFA